MNVTNFIKEVKAAVIGKRFKSSRKKRPKTAEEVCMEELNKGE